MITPKLFLRSIIKVILSIPLVPNADSCTRVLWSTNSQAVLVARTMDWGDSTDPGLWVFPRGLLRNGQTTLTPLTWTSNYASLVTSAYGRATVDGINEMGLAGHILYLKESHYHSQKPEEPVMTSGIWLQYILDNYATVADAVRDSKNWRVVLDKINDQDVKIHIAIEDTSGDSAIFEYIDQKLKVYHNKNYTILTNSPAYKVQLNQECSKQIQAAVTLDMKSSERFCLATNLLSALAPSQTLTDSILTMKSLIKNLSVPSSPTNKTFYRIISDLTHGRYFFDNAFGGNFFWVNLNELNLSTEAEIKYLNPLDTNLKGNVSHQFRSYSVIPY